jgi:hypothetical protein
MPARLRLATSVEKRRPGSRDPDPGSRQTSTVSSSAQRVQGLAIQRPVTLAAMTRAGANGTPER